MPAYTAGFLMTNLLIKILSCMGHGVQFIRISGNHKVRFLMPAPPKPQWPKRKSSIADQSTSTQDQMPVIKEERHDQMPVKKCQEEESLHQLFGMISTWERSNLQFFKFTVRMIMLVQHFLRSDHVLAPAGKKQNSVNCITRHERKTSYIAWWHNMSAEKEFYLCQWQLKFWFCYCLIQENIPITKGKGQPTNMKHDGKGSMKIVGREFCKYCQKLQIK